MIAKEGWPFIGLALILFIITALWSVWLSLPFLLILVFVVQFFRDPARVVPHGDHLVLSPADGKIVAISEAHDPYAKRQALKISVFMNVFNVHSNRMPVSGHIVDIKYFKGSFVNADLDKASLENERNAMLIETKSQQTVTCVQVAGLVARRILCYAKEGMKLGSGDRYGFIRFGSRVDVYLPLQAKPAVMIGDKVKATETVLAYLAEDSQTTTTE